MKLFFLTLCYKKIDCHQILKYVSIVFQCHYVRVRHAGRPGAGRRPRTVYPRQHGRPAARGHYHETLVLSRPRMPEIHRPGNQRCK